MNSIIKRVKALQFPPEEMVVIGSGLLDALGLRSSDDIDLAVSDALFTKLEESGEYARYIKHDELCLIKGDIEIWKTWGRDAPFASLKAEATTIEGIKFVNKEFLINWKLQSGRPKDLRDVALLRKE